MIRSGNETPIIALFEAYFDESGSHEGSPILCVAGYLFDEESRAELNTDWQQVLDEYSLPFFRMSACAHGAYPFKDLSIERRIDCETKIIAIIKKHMRMGVSVTVNEAQYEEWRVPPEIFSGSAYPGAATCV